MLHFIKFQKSYGRYLALQMADVAMEDGIYWVKGMNGSGKSTLLKTIAGILHFEGDILLNGRISLKKQGVAYRRLVNFAEAEPLFPEFLTGQELIRLFASAKEAPLGQEMYFIESMQMQSYVQYPVGTYSSGMLKKLSLVLAFLGNPTLILLDEPFITIDTPSLTTLYGWIAEKHQREGTSFLLSSHQALDSAALPITQITQEILVEQQTVKLKA